MGDHPHTAARKPCESLFPSPSRVLQPQRSHNHVLSVAVEPYKWEERKGVTVVVHSLSEYSGSSAGSAK